MLENLLQPWPWWVSGLLIGLTVPAVYFFAGKSFGISTSLQQMGAMCTSGRGPAYLKDFDRRSGRWTIVFVVGIAIGSGIATFLLSHAPLPFLPKNYHSVGGGIRLLIGGFLIGFGARYAGGCTSGHAITGIANLNPPSLIATCCFFTGGLAVTWGFGSWIF